jgi:O-6-methylguanine DNA methyltransferase
MEDSVSFRQTIYSLTSQIPKGKVATYGQLARLAGKPKTARAVGYLMKTNPHAPVVPCHRVVAADGSLRGYSGGHGLATKRSILLAEGVVFDGEKVDLTKSLWIK